MKDRIYKVGKVNISVTDPQDAERKITEAALGGITDYICVSNVRTVLYANKHEDYCKLMNEAFMCLPDGMPLIWMARLWGLNNVRRTDGPRLFVSMLQKPQNGVRHFLLGDTEESLQKISTMYRDALIAGTYSPPFKPLAEYDIRAIADRINESGAHVVWISLRAPKQDELAQMLKPYLKNKLCIGVGAAFRFALGEYQHPNKVIQKLGLTGFFWRKIGMREAGTYIKYAMNLVKWGG